MKRYKNRKAICLTAAALILTAGVSTGRALAYFTTYASASGGAQLSLGFTTTVPDEEFDQSDWTKHVTIANTGEYECYVRAQAFAGDSYGLTYIPSDDAWRDGKDGYWYYTPILAAGASTSELLVKIDKPEDASEEFNVIVVQEHTAVLYDEEGNPYADWDLKAGDTAGGTEGGGQR